MVGATGEGNGSYASGSALTEDYLLVGAAHESSGARGINGSLSEPALENSGAAYLFARSATGFNRSDAGWSAIAP